MKLLGDISYFVPTFCLLAPLLFFFSIHSSFSRGSDNDNTINSITYLATHQPTHYAPNGLYENDENDEFHSLYYYLCTFFLLLVRLFLIDGGFHDAPFFLCKKTILSLFLIPLYSPLSFLFIFPDYCSPPQCDLFLSHPTYL